jgi:hypothetical protein
VASPTVAFNGQNQPISVNQSGPGLPASILGLPANTTGVYQSPTGDVLGYESTTGSGLTPQGALLHPGTAPGGNPSAPATPVSGASQSQPQPAQVPSTGADLLTTGGASTSDPNAVAYYNDVISQLQSQLAGAQAQEGTGLNNITQGYNDAVNQQNQSESSAESGYATSRAQNGTQRENNIGAINLNANQAYNALLGILGMSGAGVSSAAAVGAPQAVAKNASSQRAGADTTFNQNDQSITTAEDQTKQSFANALKDLLTQKNTQTQNFESGLLNTEGQLQQQIRDAQINRAEYGGQPYATAAAGAGNTTQAISDIQAKLGQIFQQYATPQFNVNPVTVTQPNTTNYSVDPTTVRAQNANPSTDSSFLPYLASLKQNNAVNPILTGSTPAPVAAGAA